MKDRIKPRPCGVCKILMYNARPGKLFCSDKCRMKCHNDARAELLKRAKKAFL